MIKHKTVIAAASLLLLLMQTLPQAFGQTPATRQSSMLLPPEEMPQSIDFLPGPPEVSDGRFLYDSTQYFVGKALRDTPRGQQAIEDACLDLGYFMARFSPAVQRDFTPENYPSTAEFIEITFKTVRSSIQKAKDTFARARPYQHFNEHTPIPEGEAAEYNTSYPSGHTSRAWAIALCLVSIDPEHQDAILKTGYEMGQSRVILGYHYQSDVDDARLAASAAFARLCALPRWQELRAAALKEFRR